MSESAKRGATQVSRLVDQLQRAHDGEPWHGSPVKAIVAGVTAAGAAAPGPGGAHSIWEIVLHLTGWRREAAARARGAAAGEPPAGDWPPVGEPTRERWAQALADLDAAHRELCEVVRGLSDAELMQPTNDPRSGGAGATVYELLHGITQHDAYHAGQISLLRKIHG